MTCCAFLLAAGMGNRLAPLTAHWPKPMMPLGNYESLIESIILRIEKAGISEFGVNTHYLRECLEPHLKECVPSIRIFPEAELLNTGGPLIHARAFLSAHDSFLIHNGDILSDLDLNALIATHEAEGNLFTLALIEGPENRILTRLNNDGTTSILDVGGRLNIALENPRMMTYMGIGVFSKKFLNYLPKDVQNYDIRLAFVDAIRAGEKVGGYCVPKNTKWCDLGTLDKYLEHALKMRSECDENTNKKFSIQRLAEQGSARAFYRLTAMGESVVLMRSYSGDPDFERFVDFAQFLREAGVAVPQIYGVNKDNLSVLMEDLGDATILNLFTPDQKGFDLYSKVVQSLVHFNTAHHRVSLDDVSAVRLFDYDYLRWETNYFKTQLLERHFNLKFTPEENAILEAEFDGLATRVLNQEKVWMHRDCQSQNILQQNGEIRWVDFQGGRLGPIGYDVMALLYDPYVKIPPEWRAQLMSIYYHEYDRICGGISFDETAFHAMCVEAGLQRLMQALGAYGFLSYEKGKRKYLDFIPTALQSLDAILSQTTAFPFLKLTIKKLLNKEG